MVAKRRKDIEQEAARLALKLAREERKAALMQEPNLERTNGTEPLKKSVILFTESKNTETTYFKKFGNSQIKIVSVGAGKSTCKLVNEVTTLLRTTYRAKKFDEKVVFDKDDNKDFDDAIQLAERSGLKVAYSNQAVEYRFILHFNDHQGGAMHRDRCCELINQYIEPLGAKYDDTKIVSSNFFDIMQAKDPQAGKSRMQLAFDRAVRIYRKKRNKTEESVTTVHNLIQSITGVKYSKEK